MSLNRQARIELEPTHVGYRAWWMVPLPYQAIPALVAAVDVFWIIALSVVVARAYIAITAGQSVDTAQSIGVGLAVATAFSTAGHARGLYRTSDLLRTRSQIGNACAVWIMTFLCLATVAFALKISAMFSRGTVLLFFCTGLIVIAGSRICVAGLIRRVIAAGLLGSRRIVLLAEEDQWARRDGMRRFEPYGHSLSRVFTISAAHGVDAPGVAERVADMVRYIRQRRPDEVILAIPWHHSTLIRYVAHELRSVPTPVRLLTDPELEWLFDRRWHDLGPAKAVELQGTPLSTLQHAAKRMFDLTLASGSLILLLPVLVVIALAIRIDSPGPILFRQGRIGFNGRAFRIYKFRTMTTLEDGPNIRQASRNDQRVTRVGRLLRRYSLDELPQVVNVLRGEMSIVGPRPHALVHDDQYSRLIAEYAARHKVKPGITGWAQINGCRGETPHVDMMKRRVTYDLWYIDYWSLWLDVRIIARTAIHVLKDRDVY
jgi:Undecaprenyl-phosphate glucose phosphotransferase